MRQLDAYNDCLKRCRFYKYTDFIVADGFLLKMDSYADMLEIVDSIMAFDPNTGGVAANWRVLG